MIKYIVTVLLLHSIASCNNQWDTGAVKINSESSVPRQNSNAKEDQSATIARYKNLLSLGKYLQEKGYSLIDNRNRYKLSLDTAYYSQSDSLLIYSLSKDEVLDLYTKYSVCKDCEDIKTVVGLLDRAIELNGIIYGNDHFVDQWIFDNESDVKTAEQTLRSKPELIFYKTMTFATSDSMSLYIFRARDNGASWDSKRHFEWFTDNLEQ